MHKCINGRTPQGVRGLKPDKQGKLASGCLSHSARSAWIETPLMLSIYQIFLSHSARSAWIETSTGNNPDNNENSRTPQGVRGLKQRRPDSPHCQGGRTPQGVRGLKLQPEYRKPCREWSHSARSAWIETHNTYNAKSRLGVALRKECVD